jgi:hypothetical protein
MAKKSITTGRSKSLKRSDIYDELRQKGYSKAKSARISNAVANHTINHHSGKRIKR